eukprot:CAMPEP_0175300324 /NCGR_PEP_ID=MMETSP0093-20121207/61054_1 /TAXON_ID=311494 /ORGANISM="Alexandrium monilatum, Strain CCMP3105" /LENGTH=57 /DNA_ID=CAMNT_0016596485 /DNA_START=204 /DNA_END=374 /DNA_ORIENTATION=+
MPRPPAMDSGSVVVVVVLGGVVVVAVHCCTCWKKADLVAFELHMRSHWSRKSCEVQM